MHHVNRIAYSARGLERRSEYSRKTASHMYVAYDKCRPKHTLYWWLKHSNCAVDVPRMKVMVRDDADQEYCRNGDKEHFRKPFRYSILRVKEPSHHTDEEIIEPTDDGEVGDIIGSIVNGKIKFAKK